MLNRVFGRNFTTAEYATYGKKVAQSIWLKYAKKCPSTRIKKKQTHQ